MRPTKISKLKQINFILVFAIFIAVGAFVAGVFFINSSSENSKEYAILLEERDLLRFENQVLQNKISKYSALENIKKIAQDYGMVNITY